MTSKWNKSSDYQNNNNNNFKASGNKSQIKYREKNSNEKSQNDAAYSEIASYFVKELHNEKNKLNTNNTHSDFRVIKVHRDDNLTITFNNVGQQAKPKFKQKYQDRKSCINLSANNFENETVNKSKPLKVTRFRSQSPPERQKPNFNDDIQAVVKRNKKPNNNNNQSRPFSMYNGYNQGPKPAIQSSHNNNNSQLKKGRSNYDLSKASQKPPFPNNNNYVNKQFSYGNNNKQGNKNKNSSIRIYHEDGDKNGNYNNKTDQKQSRNFNRNIFTSDKWFRSVISSNEKKLNQTSARVDKNKQIDNKDSAKELKVAQTDMTDFPSNVLEDFNDDIEQYRLRIDLDGFTVHQPHTSNPILKIPLSTWNPIDKNVYDGSDFENDTTNKKALSIKKSEKQILFNEKDIKKFHEKKVSSNNSEISESDVQKVEVVEKEPELKNSETTEEKCRVEKIETEDVISLESKETEEKHNEKEICNKNDQNNNEVEERLEVNDKDDISKKIDEIVECRD